MMSYTKYRPYPTMDMPNRKWPGNTITKAPVWCSVDMRDGNQSLEPARKTEILPVSGGYRV